MPDILPDAAARPGRDWVAKVCNGEPDGLIEHPVEGVKGRALQTHAIFVGQIVDAAAQDVVLRHHFFDVERIVEALQAVRRRAPASQSLRNRQVAGSTRAPRSTHRVSRAYGR